jgi:hypothetical protein
MQIHNWRKKDVIFLFEIYGDVIPEAEFSTKWNLIPPHYDKHFTRTATSTSNIEILERFQSKALRMIVDAPLYVSNTVIRRDLQIPTIKEEIRRYSSQYSARLSAHPNDLITNLIELQDNKTPAKWSAYQIPSVTVVFVILVLKFSL